MLKETGRLEHPGRGSDKEIRKYNGATVGAFHGGTVSPHLPIVHFGLKFGSSSHIWTPQASNPSCPTMEMSEPGSHMVASASVMMYCDHRQSPTFIPTCLDVFESRGGGGGESVRKEEIDRRT